MHWLECSDMESGKPKNRSNKVIVAVLIFSTLVIIGLAASVPFYFETTTIWYKTGLDKTFLRFGQVAGMIALCLILLQIIIAVRGAYLESWCGVANLVRLHQVNGLLICLLILVHALLILLPEGLNNLPIGRKYWPEMVGGVALVALLATTFFSYFREALKIGYQRWRFIHRPLGYLIALAVVIHVLFVSDVFTSGVLRSLLVSAGGGVSLYVLVVKTLLFMKK